MGAADALIIVGGIAVIGYLGYMHATGQLNQWLASAQPAPAAPGRLPPGTGKTPITSTLCKCGSGTAKHVIGDCNACKSTCAATCGNCSPQCLGTKTSVPSSSFAQSFATYPMRGLIVS